MPFHTDITTASPCPAGVAGCNVALSQRERIVTKDEIKKAVLDRAWQSCMDDGGYLANLIEWAYRDYTDADYEEELAIMNEGRE